MYREKVTLASLWQTWRLIESNTASPSPNIMQHHVWKMAISPAAFLLVQLNWRLCGKHASSTVFQMLTKPYDTPLILIDARHCGTTLMLWSGMKRSGVTFHQKQKKVIAAICLLSMMKVWWWFLPFFSQKDNAEECLLPKHTHSHTECS